MRYKKKERVNKEKMQELKQVDPSSIEALGI